MKFTSVPRAGLAVSLSVPLFSLEFVDYRNSPGEYFPKTIPTLGSIRMVPPALPSNNRDHGDRRRRTGRLQTQTQQSFDSRLLCRVLYFHFRHICLTKNTRPTNPFNLSFSVISNLKSKPTTCSLPHIPPPPPLSYRHIYL